MARLEKTEENRFVQYVRDSGWKAVKLTTAGVYGEVGWNDRMVLAPWGIAIFFEFKREGEGPTKIQHARHRELRRMGFETHVVYTSDEAKTILHRAIHSQTISTGMRKVWCIACGGRFSPRSGTGKDRHRAVRVQDTAKARPRR